MQELRSDFRLISSEACSTSFKSEKDQVSRIHQVSFSNGLSMFGFFGLNQTASANLELIRNCYYVTFHQEKFSKNLQLLQENKSLDSLFFQGLPLEKVGYRIWKLQIPKLLNTGDIAFHCQIVAKERGENPFKVLGRFTCLSSLSPSSQNNFRFLEACPTTQKQFNITFIREIAKENFHELDSDFLNFLSSYNSLTEIKKISVWNAALKSIHLDFPVHLPHEEPYSVVSLPKNIVTPSVECEFSIFKEITFSNGLIMLGPIGYKSKSFFGENGNLILYHTPYYFIFDDKTLPEFHLEIIGKSESCVQNFCAEKITEHVWKLLLPETPSTLRPKDSRKLLQSHFFNKRGLTTPLSILGNFVYKSFIDYKWDFKNFPQTVERQGLLNISKIEKVEKQNFDRLNSHFQNLLGHDPCLKVMKENKTWKKLFDETNPRSIVIPIEPKKDSIDTFILTEDVSSVIVTCAESIDDEDDEMDVSVTSESSSLKTQEKLDAPESLHEIDSPTFIATVSELLESDIRTSVEAQNVEETSSKVDLVSSPLIFDASHSLPNLEPMEIVEIKEIENKAYEISFSNGLNLLGFFSCKIEDKATFQLMKGSYYFTFTNSCSLDLQLSFRCFKTGEIYFRDIEIQQIDNNIWKLDLRSEHLDLLKKGKYKIVAKDGNETSNLFSILGEFELRPYLGNSFRNGFNIIEESENFHQMFKIIKIETIGDGNLTRVSEPFKTLLSTKKFVSEIKKEFLWRKVLTDLPRSKRKSEDQMTQQVVTKKFRENTPDHILEEVNPQDIVSIPDQLEILLKLTALPPYELVSLDEEERSRPAPALHEISWKNGLRIMGRFGFECNDGSLCFLKKDAYLIASNSPESLKLDNNFFLEIPFSENKEAALLKIQKVSKNVWQMQFSDLQEDRHFQIINKEGHENPFDVLGNFSLKTNLLTKWRIDANTTNPKLEKFPNISAIQKVTDKSFHKIHESFVPFVSLAPISACQMASVDGESYEKIRFLDRSLRASLIATQIFNYECPLPMITQEMAVRELHELIFHPAQEIDLAPIISRGAGPGNTVIDPLVKFHRISAKNGNPWFGVNFISTNVGKKCADWALGRERYSSAHNSRSPLAAWTSLDRAHLTPVIQRALPRDSRSLPEGIKPYKLLEAVRRTFPCSYQFPPLFVKSLIHYLETQLKISIKSMLDPCAGYGGRLIGAYGASLDYYLGVDPNQELIHGYKKMQKVFGQIAKTKTLIVPEPFEETDLQKARTTLFGSSEDHAKFDLSFTSPPYFDTEVYSEESTQSSTKFKTLETWVGGFLYPMLDKMEFNLKVSGVLAIQIKNNSFYNFSDPMNTYLLARENLKFLGVVGMTTSSMKNSRTQDRESGEIIDPVWIYQKIA